MHSNIAKNNRYIENLTKIFIRPVSCKKFGKTFKLYSFNSNQY